MIVFTIGILPDLTGYWSNHLSFRLIKVIGALLFAIFIFSYPSEKKNENRSDAE